MHRCDVQPSPAATPSQRRQARNFYRASARLYFRNVGPLNSAPPSFFPMSGANVAALTILACDALQRSATLCDAVAGPTTAETTASTRRRTPPPHPRDAFVCARVAAPSVGPVATSLTHTTTTTTTTHSLGLHTVDVAFPPLCRPPSTALSIASGLPVVRFAAAPMSLRPCHRSITSPSPTARRMRTAVPRSRRRRTPSTFPYSRPRAIRAVTRFHGRPFAPSLRIPVFAYNSNILDPALHGQNGPLPHPHPAVRPDPPPRLSPHSSDGALPHGREYSTSPSNPFDNDAVGPPPAERLLRDTSFSPAASSTTRAVVKKLHLLSAVPSPSTSFAWIRLRASPCMLAHDRTFAPRIARPALSPKHRPISRPAKPTAIARLPSTAFDWMHAVRTAYYGYCCPTSFPSPPMRRPPHAPRSCIRAIAASTPCASRRPRRPPLLHAAASTRIPQTIHTLDILLAPDSSHFLSPFPAAHRAHPPQLHLSHSE
ncbi:hypothetical protein B0H10DRAFT_2227659 [Mycena sp. CBHHK59/15]|nr:hypothetical protein B0H10DRAFT_2227659 [Mycena sp. CBHHK59/15]